MGMDLIPNHGECGVYSLNWGGWELLANLLESLGCPTQWMAWSNDGKEIPPEVCVQYAAAIRGSIYRIKAVRVVQDAATDIVFVVTDTGNDLNPGDTTSTGTPNHKDVMDISRRERAFLDNTADFFQRCGGCSQW